MLSWLLNSAAALACELPVPAESVRLERFIQSVPVTGATPSRRTELVLWQDDNMLHVRICAEDPEPGGIVARQMRRDVHGMLAEDRVTLVVDVEGNGRNAYLFAVNALGAQYDALIFDGGQMREDWDARWHSEARVHAQGWSAQLDIPLSVFAQGTTARGPWRINAERWMPRGNERVRLAGISPDREVYSLGDGVAVPAMRSREPGLGLRVKPSLRARSESAAASGTGKARHELEPGLELFHESRQGLRTTAAFNTDFGEAEVDERVVNLSRFELFLPEKREFFLRDAGHFSFGGLDDSAVMPYYSRRIGLDDGGRARNLDAGLKLTGQIQGVDYGVFGARVAGGPTEPGLPDQPATDVAVLRLARGLGDHHRLGFIGTRGDTAGNSDSHLEGVDYQYRLIDWQGDKTLAAYAWAMTSDNAAQGRGQAWGGSLDYPNLGPTGYIELQRVGEGFRPALGYLAEDGVTRGSGSAGWWRRTEAGTDLVPGVDWSFRRRLDGSEQSWLVNPEYAITNAAGDTVIAEAFFEAETLATDYDLLPGVTIPAGRHDWHYLFGYLETARSRPLWGHAELRRGGYYDGRRDEQVVSLGWHTGPRWAWDIGLKRDAIALPGGSYTVKMATLRLDYTPSTRLGGNILLQWDNVSNQMGASARLRWQWSARSELIVALDHLRYSNALRHVEPTQTSALLKLVWNLEK